MNSKNLKNALKLVPIFIVLVAGIWYLQHSPTLTPESRESREALADQLEMEGDVRDNFIGEEGEEGEDPEEENEALMAAGDYFAHRYTYPTGNFEQQWLLDAAEQDRQVAEGVPAGQVNPALQDSLSPLNLDPTQFTSLGPQPLQSDGCSGCYAFGHVAGRTNFIVSDPVSTNIAYLGSDGGGVWKTVNCCSANTTWEAVTDDPMFNSIAIGHLFIDPNDHNTIYAGTGDLRYGSFSFGAAGLLKSTDGGQNWTIQGASVFGGPYPPDGIFPQYQAIGKVAVDPNDSSNVIVGTKTGLFFSYDGGTNWDGPCYTNSFSTQRQDMTGLNLVDEGSTTTVFAAVGTRGFPTAVQPDLDMTGANGVYSTTLPASGCPASWNLLNNGWPAGTGDGNPANDQVGRIDMDISPSNPDVIYAQVGSNTNSSGTLGVFRTSDGGATWTNVATPADFLGCTNGIGQTWYNAGVTVDPNNPDVVFLSMIDVYRSTNGGDTFTNLTTGYCGGNQVHVDNHARAFVGGSSDTLLVGSDGGVYVTLNATATNPTFTKLNDTLSTIEFYSGAITGNFANATNPGINAGAQDNGSAVYVWNGVNPGPAQWQVRKGGDGMFARIEPVLEQRWYQESQNGNLAVSQIGPFGPLQNISGGWGGDRLSFVFPYEIYRYSCPGTGCDHMIAGSYRVWESITGGIPGSSWLINSPDLTKGTLADRSTINQLDYAVSDNSIAIVGTNDGNVQYGFNMGQGVANSATWVDVTGSNSVLPNRPILDVTTDTANPLVGYAAVGGFSQNTPGTPGHIYQVTCTANCGSFTWLDKSGNLPNVPADSVIVNPLYPQQVFAGTDWGLYYTDDITVGSPVWYKFTAGLPSVMIWDMSIDYDGSMGATTLALYTRSRGAYVWPLRSGPINVDYAASLAPNTNIDSLPGTSVTHDFVLTNVGQQDDTYNLAVSGQTWQSTLQTSTPIAVASGMTATVQVQVDIPNTPNTSDSFTITATSVNSPTVSASAVGTTNAVVNPAVDATTPDDSQSGSPGDVLTYTVNVTNNGDYTDTFAVDLSGNVWPTTASTNSVGPLAAGDSASIEIYVTVGTSGSDSVTVTLISGLDTNVSDSVTLTSVVDTFMVYLPAVFKP
ncbi:MAG: hypothetical protein WAM60_17540 [Candidatus Promineifilaceae bacterium]